MLLVVLLFALVHGGSVGRTSAGEEAHIASGRGLVHFPSGDVIVEVLVVVQPHEDEDEQVRLALMEIHPTIELLDDGDGEIQSSNYTTNGLVWNTLPVIVNYNAAGAPASIDDQGALERAMASWTAVPTSFFEYVFGGTTTRCPSMYDGCPGPQVLDGNNDVGWDDIPINGVIGVTWHSTAEFDIVLDNANFAWYTGALPVAPGAFDLETVNLHELGHAAGLGHSSNNAAVMYPSVSPGVSKRTPHQDDADGISSIYPATTPLPTATPTPTGTPTETPPSTSSFTATPTPSTPSFTATPTPTACSRRGCPSPTPTLTQSITPTPSTTLTATPVTLTPTPTITPTPTPAQPDLTVVEVVDSGPVVSDDTLTYTIEVRNIGSAGAGFVRLLDTPAANFTYTTFGTTRGSCVLVGSTTGGILDCDLGSFGIGPTAFATITISGYVTTAADITVDNIAAVDPDDVVLESDEANNSVTISTNILAPTPTACSRRGCPSPTPTLTQSITPTPSTTLTPTATPTSTPTPSITPTPSAAPPPTVTPTSRRHR